MGDTASSYTVYICMMFGRKGNNVNIDIQVNGASIERVKEIKVLGIIVEDTLNWKPHI